MSDSSGNQPRGTSGSSDSNQTVRAQGQLLPSGGIVRIMATPGDVIESILVEPGDSVETGRELATLRSLAIRQTQITTLKLRLGEAERQQKLAIDEVRLKQTAAQAQLEQAESQVLAVGRQTELLELGRRQLASAQAVLDRMESIAGDPKTKAFISVLEIERQKVTVGDAQLQYRQQEESHIQAKQSAQWARTVARQQLDAANVAVKAAQESSAIDIARQELETAQQQLELTRVNCPIQGVVLSIDANVGETTSQFPLMQIANLANIQCEAEVYQSDAVRIRPGQSAVIHSEALGAELTGSVVRVERLVGRPKFRPTDPLARVDYRTVSVVIAVDKQHCAKAADWLQLQVDVAINTGGASNSPDPDRKNDK